MQTRSFDDNFHNLALFAVAIAASTGCAATAVVWISRGTFETTTFLASLGALTAAAFVWVLRRRKQ